MATKGQTTYVKRSVPYKFDKGWFDLELARIARATKVITRDGVGGPIPLTFPTFAPASEFSRSGWTASAPSTLGGTSPANAIDGLTGTKWVCGHGFINGDYLQIDFGAQLTVAAMLVDNTGCDKNSANQVQVQWSVDNITYNVGPSLTVEPGGASGTAQVYFNGVTAGSLFTARYVRLMPGQVAANNMAIGDVRCFSANYVATLQKCNETIRPTVGKILTIAGFWRKQRTGSATGLLNDVFTVRVGSSTTTYYELAVQNNAATITLTRVLAAQSGIAATSQALGTQTFDNDTNIHRFQFDISIGPTSSVRYVTVQATRQNAAPCSWGFAEGYMDFSGDVFVWATGVDNNCLRNFTYEISG